MRIKMRLISALAAAVTAASLFALSASASDKYYYDKTAVKELIKLYEKDAAKAEQFIRDDERLQGTDDICHILLTDGELELLRSNDDGGVVMYFTPSGDMGESTGDSSFCFTFFQKNGANYRTPTYDAKTVRALSIKQLISESGVPDRGKIALAELCYSGHGERWLTCRFDRLNDGWLAIDCGDGSQKPRGFTFDESGKLITKSSVINGVRYTIAPDGECQGTYTGWTKTKSGSRRYYDRGRTLEGWQKVNGKHYYFSIDGYAATGKVKIRGCTYTFDKNGAWTGKRSKAGARPADFAVSYSSEPFCYDSATGKMSRLINEDYVDGKRTEERADAVYKLPAKDKQVIWSIINEYDLMNADDKTRYDDDKVIAKLLSQYPEAESGDYDPDFSYTLRITADGKTKEFHFCAETENLYKRYKTITGLWDVYLYTNGLVRSSEAYKSLPRSEMLWV